MPAATYGVENPGGTDPWAIESTLAPLATGGSSAVAGMMLADYRAQREADSNRYRSAQDAQHKFAYDQLANQLLEAKMKLVPELAGKPGGVAFMASNPTLNEGVGGSPDAWSAWSNTAQQSNDALNLKNAGQGAQGFSNSGAQFSNTNQLVPGLNVAMGENVQVQRAKIDAAARLGAAAMHAKSGGGVPEGAEGGLSTPVTNVFGTQSTVSKGKKETTEHYNTRLERDFNQHRVDPQPGSQAPPGAGAGTGTTGAGADTGGGAGSTGGRTSLQRNPSTNNTAAGVRAAQQQVLANEGKMLSNATPAQRQAYTEAKAANGGMPRVAMTPQGPQLVDKRGNPL